MNRIAKHSTIRFVLAISTLAASLGIVGYIALKVGLIDIVVTVVVQTALMFIMMFVILGILNESTYNLLVDEVSDGIAAAKNLFKKQEEEKTEEDKEKKA